MTYIPLLWLWRLWALGIAIIALVIGLLPFAAAAIYLHDRFSCPVVFEEGLSDESRPTTILLKTAGPILDDHY